MKKYFLFIIIVISNFIVSQSKNNQNDSMHVNGFYYHQTTPNISNDLYEKIHEELNNNLKYLKKNNNLIAINTNSDLKYAWPLKQADGFNYPNYWLIANYFDHDVVRFSVTDYNCGQKTFDFPNDYDYGTGTSHGHRAVDIVPSPYPWKMMDNEQVEVIAAADGQIILKFDGHKDDNCDVWNSDTIWNAVFLKHSDGSTTWYGRLKSGTLTNKNIGDYVEKGEFLGHPGSGGKSAFPHLHFEVYDAQNSSVDPFAGPCNNQIEDSLWESQPIYAIDDTVVTTILTHSDLPVLESCGQTEYNLSNEFLPGSTVYPIVYFRAAKNGQRLFTEIINPLGVVAHNNQYTFTQDWQSNYVWDSYSIPSNNNFSIGTWLVRATFDDIIYTYNFEVKTSLSISDQQLNNTFLIEKNKSILQIISSKLIDKAEIYDINGRLIKSSKFDNKNYEIGIQDLKSGVYVLNIFNDSLELLETLKFVKN